MAMHRKPRPVRQYVCEDCGQVLHYRDTMRAAVRAIGRHDRSAKHQQALALVAAARFAAEPFRTGAQ